MSRQTVFPNVVVDSIRATGPGGGVTREDEFGMLLGDITPDSVESLIDSFEDMVGPFSDDHKIEYNLIVSGYSERGAKAKARSYTRAKNPFEPEFITIESLEKTKAAETKMRLPAMSTFRITTSVTK